MFRELWIVSRILPRAEVLLKVKVLPRVMILSRAGVVLRAGVLPRARGRCCIEWLEIHEFDVGVRTGLLRHWTSE